MAQPPNILVILTDQQRLDTISARSNSFGAKTPAIDKLYRHGIFFDNAYCTAPICGPSRSTILTGLQPTQTGVYANLGNPCSPLNEKHVTIGNRMQALGYETVYHGKWHLGGTPKTYGFEVVYETGHDASTVLEASRFWRHRDWMVYKRPFFQILSLLNPHDVYFFDPEDEADPTMPAWPNQNDDLSKKPWPQRGLQAKSWSPRRWEAYRQYYARKIEEVDRDIGAVVHQAINSGYGPNTWIILTSDHGDMAGEHGIPFKGPFMYEGVTRVPLLIVPPQERFSGKGKGGIGAPPFQPRTYSKLVSLIDIVPTVLELAGAPADATLPGRSLIPAVRDDNAPGHEAVYAEWHQSGKMATPIRMLRTGDWKYNLYLGHGAELYNLALDTHEMNNLAGDPEAAAVERELHAKLLAHLREIRDPFFTYIPTNAAGEPFTSQKIVAPDVEH